MPETSAQHEERIAAGLKQIVVESFPSIHRSTAEKLFDHGIIRMTSDDINIAILVDAYNVLLYGNPTP